MALRVKCVDGSDWSRAVTWPMTSQFLICISRDLSMEATILFCCHVVLRWYGHQEALLQRHSSSFAYDNTVPHLHITWPLYGGRHLVLLPCCFAMIRSPEGAATSQLTFWWVESRHVTYDVTAPPLLSKMRRFWGTVLRWHNRQGTLQVKVKGRWRAFWLVESPMTSPHQVWIQLSVRIRVSNPNRKFQKKKTCRNEYQLGLGLVTLMKGQRSKVTYLLYLYNCQLGLGLVTLMEGQRSPTFCTYTIASQG